MIFTSLDSSKGLFHKTRETCGSAGKTSAGAASARQTDASGLGLDTHQGSREETGHRHH